MRKKERGRKEMKQGEGRESEEVEGRSGPFHSFTSSVAIQREERDESLFTNSLRVFLNNRNTLSL